MKNNPAPTIANTLFLVAASSLVASVTLVPEDKKQNIEYISPILYTVEAFLFLVAGIYDICKKENRDPETTGLLLSEDVGTEMDPISKFPPTMNFTGALSLTIGAITSTVIHTNDPSPWLFSVAGVFFMLGSAKAYNITLGDPNTVALTICGKSNPTSLPVEWLNSVGPILFVIGSGRYIINDTAHFHENGDEDLQLTAALGYTIGSLSLFFNNMHGYYLRKHEPSSARTINALLNYSAAIAPIQEAPETGLLQDRNLQYQK